MYSAIHKIGIEYNGLWWHTEYIHPSNYHLNKYLHYKKKGIRVIQIWSHWWKKRSSQVQNYLKAVFGLNEKIHGRKTVVRQVDRQTAWEFNEKHHILGAKKRTILALGLYFEDKLVMLTTYSKHHRTSKEVVLDRMCSVDGISVIGGLSRLSKAASEILKCDVFTWADLCISSGEGYIKSGWEQVSVSKPSYFYYNKSSHKICSKQSRQKSAVNTPDNMTEHQHALQEGWLRVYDCGKIKFKYPLKTPTETPQS
jgi:hypothetical protein